MSYYTLTWVGVTSQDLPSIKRICKVKDWRKTLGYFWGQQPKINRFYSQGVPVPLLNMGY